MYALMVFLFFAVPVAAIVFFVISLYLFLSARKKKIENPDGISDQILKKRKVMMIVSLIIAGVLVTAVIGFIILMYFSIRHM